jgi:hypothetical protein
MFTASSLKDLKSELETRSQKELIGYCLTLSKFKKENKELLTYVLFESGNEALFTGKIKSEMDEQFALLSTEKNIYFTKKSLRKILRTVKRYSRYASSDTVSAELLIYYCKKLKDSGIPYRKSPVLEKMYNNQIVKIKSLVSGMHEDLQFDYQGELEALK